MAEDYKGVDKAVVEARIAELEGQKEHAPLAPAQEDDLAALKKAAKASK